VLDPVHGGDPVIAAAPVVLVLLAIVLVALLAPRWGADSRPGVERPPDGWFGQRS
jgi:hypothetical protein